jgi:type II secretory pathway pseudopilin PulG
MHTSRAERGFTATERGFTIVEAIVALAIVTTGVLGLAGLATQVTDHVVRARRHTIAALLADQAISARIGQPLAATPADCLQRDVAGCVEELDGAGQIAAGRPAFVRRWRVAAIGGSTPSVWGLTVCVVPVHERTTTGPAPGACVARVAWEVAP